MGIFNLIDRSYDYIENDYKKVDLFLVNKLCGVTNISIFNGIE